MKNIKVLHFTLPFFSFSRITIFSKFTITIFSLSLRIDIIKFIQSFSTSGKKKDAVVQLNCGRPKWSVQVDVTYRIYANCVASGNPNSQKLWGSFNFRNIILWTFFHNSFGSCLWKFKRCVRHSYHLSISLTYNIKLIYRSGEGKRMLK